MKIVLISASPRENSQTRKVVGWLNGALHDLGADTEILDLHEVNLPTNYNDATDEGGVYKERWLTISALLESADGYVIATPEWNGMPTGALLTLFAYVDKELAYKPVYAVSVTSGVRGGSFPIAQIKGAMNKNSMHFVVPDYLVARDSKNIFNAPEPDIANDNDVFSQARARYGLQLLVDFVEAAQLVRGKGHIDNKTYSSGM